MVLGASYDSKEANCAFADKYGYPFKLLCDVDQALAKAYHATDPDDATAPLRISYLIGPDGKIVKGYEPVKTATHADDVLADLA